MRYLINLYYYLKSFIIAEIPYYNAHTNNDKWVVELFGKKRNGFFIEAGAHNGIESSCTYTLEKYFGWRGIAVEPNTQLFAKLTGNRTCICVNKCLSGKNENVIFVEAENTWFSGIKDSLIRIEARSKKLQWEMIMDKWRSNQSVEKEIGAITLYDLLKECDAPNIIEYIALDIEGCEFDVLNAFPFDAEYKILSFSIESDECDDLLISKGYKKVKNKFNSYGVWENYFILEKMIQRQ